eukprot:CAMPEP_0170489962 /NCGR_PEP_ID=MMETSP0208-20121228/8254_1 /TAXON_ID=197538 /ORGANISM="Strombidium inclinatum, Strain S3" /LENGTH=50 /DNA_ID=CAMNT_0010765137 /DNA_START=137 /DNA_END=286 /DNA_ORIENTATION=-
MAARELIPLGFWNSVLKADLAGELVIILKYHDSIFWDIEFICVLIIGSPG